MTSQPIASSSKLTPATSSTPLTDYIEPEAPLFIAKSTVIAGLLGAALGGTVGVARSVNPVQLAGSLGTRWFVASSAFFGLREYLISPLLLANQATRVPPNLPPTQPTKAGMRTARVLDSAITGAFGGPIMVVFRDTFARLRHPGGPRNVLRASFTCALITASAQLLVNQGRILRLDILARREARSVPASPGREVEKGTSEQVRDALRTPTRDPDGERLGEKSLPGRIVGGMSTFLPIQKLSDEDYLQALQKRRNQVDTRLRDIEREEVRIYEYAERAGRQV